VKIDPVADKFTAFGFDTVEIDGNDMAALVTALANARQKDGRPKAIVLRTIPGKGIPTLMARERAHFVRVANDEWDSLITELETHNG
jgi:transketolase